MLYMVRMPLELDLYVGVKKKVLSQIRVFKKYFDRVYYTFHQNGMAYLVDEDKIIERELAVTRQAFYKIVWEWIEEYGIERTYVRHPWGDQWFVEFLKKQKEKNIKSVLEIPTYPYDQEIKNPRILLEDRYCRQYLHKYVNKITTFSEDSVIWGIPCLSIKNGIDIERIPLKENREKKEKQLTMIAVATMRAWHGYERVIHGMYHYYQNGGTYDLLFNLVGDGPELNLYQELVKKYQLESRVVFSGKLEGKELDLQYHLSDLAIGTLGHYRLDFHGKVSPLKTAEYCARGIPFVIGYEDLNFSDKEEFLFRIADNGDPVDMELVIDFYEKVAEKSGYHKRMRNYAEKNLTWDHILEPVVSCLK